MNFRFRNGVGLGAHTSFDGFGSEIETEMRIDDENGEIQDCGDSNFNPVAVPQARAAPALLHARENISQALLMESLIKLLCQKYEPDKRREKLLFNVICDILHKTQLLDRTLLFQELKATRRHYSLTFDKLFRNVREALPSENLKKDLLLGTFIQNFLSSKDVASNASEGQLPVYIHNSQYLAEFEEECCIGKGGFGIVCKAKKKVDQHHYAVKKIPFDHSDDPLFSKILREVELFAKLSHPNIVSYKTAWIENSGAEIVLNLIGSSEESATPEETDVPRSQRNFYYSMETSCDEKTLDEVELFECHEYNEERMEVWESTGMTSNYTENFNITTKRATLLKRSQSVNQEKIFEEDDSDDCLRFIPTSPRTRKKSLSDPTGDACKAMCAVESQRCNMKNIKSVLFVQMELCQENLRVWLDDRQQKVKEDEDIFNAVDVDKVMEIFKQVLEGVAYLHRNKLVHRDLKPQNIMFDQNRIAKIGDFGLATICCKCDVEHRRPWVAAVGHTKGVGTSPYAAPEQRERSNYDSKADMYSLGVILFELLVPFSTQMERAKVLKDLEEGITSDEINQKYPQQVHAVLQLVNKTASLRPSADELLDSAIFLSKDQLLSQKNREIADLKRRIAELENLLKVNSIQH